MKHTLVVFLILVILTGCDTSPYNRGTYDLYLIPEGYEGIIKVTYNVTDAPPLTREGEYDVIPVSADGKYETSTPMYDYGEVIDQYYYVDKEGNRSEIDASCINIRGTGGTGHSDGTETHHTEIEVTHTFCGEDFMLNGSTSNVDNPETARSTIPTSQSVKLTCLHQAANTSCENFVSEDPEVVDAFEAAIKNAKRMKGSLNYVAEYKLQLVNSQQVMKTYHLSLGTDRTMKGLLVDELDTMTGYEIPVEDANKLRELILE